MGTPTYLECVRSFLENVRGSTVAYRPCALSCALSRAGELLPEDGLQRYPSLVYCFRDAASIKYRGERHNPSQIRIYGEHNQNQPQYVRACAFSLFDG
jgi:hypothetical protein